jgi:hypothetical protein
MSPRGPNLTEPPPPLRSSLNEAALVLTSDIAGSIRAPYLQAGRQEAVGTLLHHVLAATWAVQEVRKLQHGFGVAVIRSSSIPILARQ